VKYILDYVRTSLRKNPEDWVFVETVRSSAKIQSFINIFHHIPTDYILFLINTPRFNLTNENPPEIQYYVTMLPIDDYEEELEMTGGFFTPDIENLTKVHPESTIVKTLIYIKNITIEDNNILKYQDFTLYIKGKNESFEEEYEDEGEDDGEN